MLPGLPERFDNELSKLVKEKEELKIISPPDRAISSWNGGCTLAQLDSFNDQWITLAEYEETGVEIVHTKCQYIHIEAG